MYRSRHIVERGPPNSTAGLSAALVLGRARKRKLLVDAGEPSNLPAHAMGGLLGQNGRSPADFYAQGREQLEPHNPREFLDSRRDGLRWIGWRGRPVRLSFSVLHEHINGRLATRDLDGHAVAELDLTACRIQREP